MNTTATKSIPNLRDLGGLPAGARRTRAHVLYRSALPTAEDATPSGFSVWPPGTVIDLRSGMEQADGAHPLVADGAALHTISLMSNAQLSRPYSGREIVALYQEIVESAGPQLVDIVRVAAEAPGPVLLHCAAGKDRTGIAVALLLSAAGVPDEEVVADYMKSNDHLADVLRRLGKGPAPERDDSDDRDRRGAVAEAIEAVLTNWAGADGGVRGWLRALGLADGELEAWSARFTGPDE